MVAGMSAPRWRSDASHTGPLNEMEGVVGVPDTKTLRAKHAGGAHRQPPERHRAPMRPIRLQAGACYATSALVMMTSSTGTSWWPPLLPVFTPLIFSTTSVPSTTLLSTSRAADSFSRQGHPIYYDVESFSLSIFLSAQDTKNFTSCEKSYCGTPAL